MIELGAQRSSKRSTKGRRLAGGCERFFFEPSEARSNSKFHIVYLFPEALCVVAWGPPALVQTTSAKRMGSESIGGSDGIIPREGDVKCEFLSPRWADEITRAHGVLS